MQFKAFAVVFLYHTLCCAQENFCSSISRNKTARKRKAPRHFYLQVYATGLANYDSTRAKRENYVRELC